MKSLLIIMAIFGLILQSSAGAVEIKKDTTDSKTAAKVESKPTTGGQDSAARPGPDIEVKSKPEQPKSAPKDFDSFVDKNNNGIDDRAEKKNPTDNPSEDKKINSFR